MEINSFSSTIPFGEGFRTPEAKKTSVFEVSLSSELKSADWPQIA